VFIGKSIAGRTALAGAAALAGCAAFAMPTRAGGVPAHRAAVAPVASAARPAASHTIWQAKFKPRSSTWTSGRFGAHGYDVTVWYRCWGNDGTKAGASIVEVEPGSGTKGSHGNSLCSGQWWHFAGAVRPTAAYRVRFHETGGHTHTAEIKVTE
jgi:hypothetical protein